MKNAYLYQGDFSEFDEDIGWNQFDLRAYDPQVGRFVQADPFHQFPSPYTDMGNDPINLIDPSGGWAATGIFEGLSQSVIMRYHYCRGSHYWNRRRFNEVATVVWGSY